MSLKQPIIGIENRTAQEVFDIMCDRISRADASSQAEIERLKSALKPFAEGSIDVSGSAVILGYPETSAALDAARAALSGSKE